MCSGGRDASHGLAPCGQTRIASTYRLLTHDSIRAGWVFTSTPRPPAPSFRVNGMSQVPHLEGDCRARFPGRRQDRWRDAGDRRQSSRKKAKNPNWGDLVPCSRCQNSFVAPDNGAPGKPWRRCRPGRSGSPLKARFRALRSVTRRRPVCPSGPEQTLSADAHPEPAAVVPRVTAWRRRPGCRCPPRRPGRVSGERRLRAGPGVAWPRRPAAVPRVP